MRIFISFASEQSKAAESIYRKLLAAGYDVFYSSDSIRAGQGYDERIRKAVIDADGVIFLASPDSLADGCYTLTELEMIARKWEDPTGVVIPVLIGGSTYADLPAYLGSVTSAIDPKGNLESGVVATVIDVWPASGGAADKRATNLVGGILIVLLVALGSWMFLAGSGLISAEAYAISSGRYAPKKSPPLDRLEDFCKAVLKNKRDWDTIYSLLTDDLRRQAEAEVALSLLELSKSRDMPPGIEGHALPPLPEEDWALLQKRGRNARGLAKRIRDWTQSRIQDGERFYAAGMKAIVASEAHWASQKSKANARSTSLLTFVATYEPYRIFEMVASRPDATEVTCWGYVPHRHAERREARFEFKLVWRDAGWRVQFVTTQSNPKQ